MMVAWHEVPGNVPKRTRPVENGMIKFTRSEMFSVGDGLFVFGGFPELQTVSAKPLIPFPTGRIFMSQRSRYFVPGYLHLVPAGQSSLRPFAATLLAIGYWLLAIFKS